LSDWSSTLSFDEVTALVKDTPIGRNAIAAPPGPTPDFGPVLAVR